MVLAYSTVLTAAPVLYFSYKQLHGKKSWIDKMYWQMNDMLPGISVELSVCPYIYCCNCCNRYFYPTNSLFVCYHAKFLLSVLIMQIHRWLKSHTWAHKPKVGVLILPDTYWTYIKVNAFMILWNAFFLIYTVLWIGMSGSLYTYDIHHRLACKVI